MTADPSVEFLDVELLAAHATREELEGFDPTPDHARACRAGSVGGTHLAGCVYCQARLFAGDGKTLRDRLVGELLGPALQRAARAAAGAVIWDEDPGLSTLAEPLSARLGDGGRVEAGGLEVLLRRSEVSYGARMSAPPGAVPEAAWDVPLGADTVRITLRAGEQPETWAVGFEPLGGNPDDWWLEVGRPGGLPGWTGRPDEVPFTGLPLATGRWELRVTAGGPVRVIPIVLGPGEG
jgi:hypothetical protein